MILAVGCATVPDNMVKAISGNTESLRVVKKELVQPMPAGENKTVWEKRLAAYITRSRSLQAWANGKDDFDTAAAFEEELHRRE